METSSYKILLVLKASNSGLAINAILDSHIKVVPWNIRFFCVLVDYDLNQYPINLYLKATINKLQGY
jgi:hypothetical protein